MVSAMGKRIHPIDAYVGNRLRLRRLMLGMSQTQLAAALDVTFKQVQNYEKGVNRITASRLEQIAAVLQVPVPFFFEGLPDNTGGRPVDDPMVGLVTTDGLRLARAFTQIADAELRRRIVRLVEEIAGSAK